MLNKKNILLEINIKFHENTPTIFIHIYFLLVEDKTTKVLMVW